MRATRGGGGTRQRHPRRGGPLNLIHTTNSPNPVTARPPGRLTLNFRDVNSQGIRELFGLVQGELSPVEFLILRRAANAAKRTT